ncbi:MAG: hypothetical protein JNK72_10270 [Myxococcales bacterium]|nr:hypothetical protein [Myxococcales bacterium]
MRDPRFSYLFVNHGVLAADALSPTAEAFALFARALTPDERAQVTIGLPAPLAAAAEVDAEFACFSGEIGAFDAAARAHSAPEPVKAARDRRGRRAGARGVAQRQSALDAFAAALDAWVAGLAARLPLIAFWGPQGAPHDDPWHRWSLTQLGPTLAPRLARLSPSTAAGRAALVRVRGRVVAQLAVAPLPAEGAVVAVLEASVRDHLPTGFVPRRSAQDAALSAVSRALLGAVARSPSPVRSSRALSPEARLVTLGDPGVYASPLGGAFPRWSAPVEEALGEVVRRHGRAGLALLVRVAQRAAGDAPGLERAPSRANLAGTLVAMGLFLEGATAATHARAARYFTWGQTYDVALELVARGIARFGPRRVLLKAGRRAAEASGDAESLALLCALEAS